MSQSSEIINIYAAREKADTSRESSCKYGARPLRYRTRALWLLAFYILLIVVPWVMTCVLAHRPINASSYIRQQGFLDDEISTMGKWQTAVGVLNSIAGLITIPVLSAILAQAAVLFCQRRKPDEFLSLRDMFALADRGWTSAPLLWSSIRTWRHMPGRKSSVRFLVPAACLILLGAIQQPLYQLLVEVSTVSVVTCRDIPSWAREPNCSSWGVYSTIGKDLEPAEMAIADQLFIRSEVASQLATISVHESQPNLWSVNATFREDSYHGISASAPRTLRYWAFPHDDLYYPYTVYDHPVLDYFVAGLPDGTTTGVLRQHLMRLNSSISCEELDTGDLPSPCPGEHPFTVFWQGVIDTDIRICVPGSYIAFPWTLSRIRQEHTEEIYIGMKNTRIASPSAEQLNPDYNTSYTIHCKAATTRGYFELGNKWNNNTYSTLLEHWPNRVDMAENFNDWTDDLRDGYIPSDVDNLRNSVGWQSTDISQSYTWKVPGPLMTSALALFGRGSWLSTAAGYESRVSPNLTDYTQTSENASWPLFCRGMPFSKLRAQLEPSFAGSNDFASTCDTIDKRSFNGTEPREQDLLLATHHLLAAFAPAEINRTLNNPESLLETAMFVADRAILTLLSAEVFYTQEVLNGRSIYTSSGVTAQKPILSKNTLIILSTLLGLQLLGLAYLTYYLYRVPTWSGQLDAIAMARIGASLHDRDVLPSIGPVNKQDLATLQTVGGLIGVVEKHPHREIPMIRFRSHDLDTTNDPGIELQRLNSIEGGHESIENGSLGVASPDLATTGGSEVELQQFTPTEQVRESFEDGYPAVQLGLDAPGSILAADVPRWTPYVFALKRAWWKTSNLGKRSARDK